MTNPFDMALFLNGVLSGSQARQQRHLRQARLMQAAIQQRWRRKVIDFGLTAPFQRSGYVETMLIATASNVLVSVVGRQGKESVCV